MGFWHSQEKSFSRKIVLGFRLSAVELGIGQGMFSHSDMMRWFNLHERVVMGV